MMLLKIEYGLQGADVHITGKSSFHPSLNLTFGRPMDRPEPDAGVRTAYVFSKPHECEEMTAGQVRGLLRGECSSSYM